VLLLRGPQTPGELRARTNRMCAFTDAAHVEATLANLMAREDGPFLARLPRAPGARESRYAHLFSGHLESVEEPAVAEESAPGTATLSQRVEQLEERVRRLQEEMDAITSALAQNRRDGAESADPASAPAPLSTAVSAPTAD
jgi:uncharacterized protein YceH (UPF0502 family)